MGIQEKDEADIRIMYALFRVSGKRLYREYIPKFHVIYVKFELPFLLSCFNCVLLRKILKQNSLKYSFILNKENMGEVNL